MPELLIQKGSISKTVVKEQSGRLIRKPSGGERARFLEEESKPRNKRIFLAGENPRADESGNLTVLEVIKGTESFPFEKPGLFYLQFFDI